MVSLVRYSYIGLLASAQARTEVYTPNPAYHWPQLPARGELAGSLAGYHSAALKPIYTVVFVAIFFLASGKILAILIAGKQHERR